MRSSWADDSELRSEALATKPVRAAEAAATTAPVIAAVPLAVIARALTTNIKRNPTPNDTSVYIRDEVA